METEQQHYEGNAVKGRGQRSHNPGVANNPVHVPALGMAEIGRIDSVEWDADFR
jgi:hypothetical protein